MDFVTSCWYGVMKLEYSVFVIPSSTVINLWSMEAYLLGMSTRYSFLGHSSSAKHAYTRSSLGPLVLSRISRVLHRIHSSNKKWSLVHTFSVQFCGVRQKKRVYAMRKRKCLLYRFFTNPMAADFSRKHWRHKSRPYLRKRPAWCAQRRHWRDPFPYLRGRENQTAS